MAAPLASTCRIPRPGPEATTWAVTGLLLLLGSLWPAPGLALVTEVGAGLLALLPVIALAAALAGALALGDVSDRVLAWVGTGTTRSVLGASLVGAITPVCGLGVLPLIAALLRRGLPLAPVMAFWIASPVTDPAMLVITAGILGLPLAIAKTVAAFAIGVLAGAVTATLPGFGGPGHHHMRADALAAHGCDEAQAGFLREAWSNARLVARWLALALVLEVLLQRHVPDTWIQAAVGGDSPASVPLAAIVGAPLYLDGYAALPLVRGLVEMGMGSGAALALLIAGAAVSLYALVAVIALVRARVLALYVVLAVLGACLAGYAADGLGVATPRG
ncbi:MAG: permease [Halofilum sp. (in: g-proteobacteria)]|nr:permease [Halofilum sp. (in: g-proteobacteria)]